MKRFKKLLILLGVLVVCCVITVIVKNTETRKEQIKNTDAVILAVDPDSVTMLSWQYDEKSLSFHKNGEWYWDDDEAFPVNEEKVHELVSIFENFGATFIIEDVDDYGQYGLDKPTCTIKLTTDTQEYTVKLGAFSSMDSQRYVSIGDGNVYLVKTDPFDSYEITIRSMLDYDKIPTVKKTEKITFSGAENYEIDYVENSTDTYCDEDVYFTTMNGKTVPVDSVNVESYLNRMHNVSLMNYVSYNVTDEELTAWGLDDPELTISITYQETEADGETETTKTFVMYIGLDQENLASKKEAEEAGYEYTGSMLAYCRIGDSPIVYQLTTTGYEYLSAVSFNELRHDEVMTAYFSEVTQIDVTLENEQYSITEKTPEEGEETPEDEDAERVFCFGEEEVDVSTLKNELASLYVSEFTDETPNGKEEISVVLHLENANYSELAITFYRYDGTYCLAVVNGETLGLVERTSVVSFIEAVNAIVLG